MKQFIIALFIGSTCILPLQAMAAETPPKVMISEVAWSGSAQSTADEWLELQNLEEEAIDLSGWSIEGGATSGGTLTLPGGARIEAHGVYLIANYAASKSTLAIEPNYVTTSVALSNSALKLVLRDASGNEVDTAGGGGAPEAGTSGSAGYASMIRVDEGWVTASSSSNFDSGVIQFGTPGVGDVVVTPVIVEPIVDELVAEPEAEVEPITEEPNGIDVPLDESDVLLPEVTVEAVPMENEESTTEQSTVVTPTADVVETEVPEETTVTAETTTETVEENETPTYSPSDLLINEIVSDPSEGNEWIELINPRSDAIDLTGWSGHEAGGTSASFAGSIAPGAFAVVEFKSKLNNSGDTITLIDPSGQIIDAVSYGDHDASHLAPDKGSSLARNADGALVVTTIVTRGEANAFPVEVVTENSETSETEAETHVTESPSVSEPDDETQAANESTCSNETMVVILNLMASPEGDDELGEYITIHNNSTNEICLDGWVIRDLSTSYALTGVIAAGADLVLARSETDIALNNTSAETVELVTPDGQVVDIATYEKAIEGAVFTQVDGAWSWTELSAATQSGDVSSVESQTGSDDTSETSTSQSGVSTTKLPKKSVVRSVEGVVIAAPDTFGNQIMYIDGLQLFQFAGDFPSLLVGDVIRVLGVPSTTHGEPRLKISSSEKVTIIGSAEVVARAVSIEEVQNHLGHLVQVGGMVKERSGDRFTLEQNGKSVIVVIKDGTKISLSSIALGSTLKVTGVVSIYDGAVRLLPRSSGDIEQILTATPIVSAPRTDHGAGNRFLGFGLVGATTTAVGARAWWYRKQKKSS